MTQINSRETRVSSPRQDGGIEADWLLWRERAARYAWSLREPEGWAFRNSPVAVKPIAIASATAALLLGFLGQDNQLTKSDRKAWASYLAGFQGPDGLFLDPIDYAEPTQSQPYWALAAHRTRHCAWAMEALAKHRLTRRFDMADSLTEPAALRRWLDELWHGEARGNAWAWGNWVMDLGVLLDLHHRHFCDPSARRALDVLMDWLDEHQDSATGYWLPGQADLRNAMAGAMHLYPLYWSCGRPVPRLRQVIVNTLDLQRSDGLFGYEIGLGGSQCLDYDAVLILSNGHHLVPGLRPPIRQACRRVLQAIAVNHHPAGSWGDCQVDELRHWATRASVYRACEGGIWDTYARLMTVAMCVNVLTNRLPAGVHAGRHLFENFQPLPRNAVPA